MSLGEVKGVVAGQFGEVSEDTHALIAAFATSRVRVAGVTRGKRGRWRTEEGERAISVTAMRRRLCVMDVKCQASSILWRLETKGPGSTAALARRQQGRKLERMWQRYMRAQAAREGWRAVRSGFGRVD